MGLDDLKRELGTELGTYAHYIQLEWASLKHTWQDWEAMFGANQDRIDLLNEASDGFFFKVRVHFLHGTILAIARLTDFPTTRVKGEVKDNLTIRALPDLCKTDNELKQKVEAVVEKAIEAAEPLKDYRNWKIGHNDKSLMLGDAKISGKVNREIISTAIAAIYQPIKIIIESKTGVECMTELTGNVNNAKRLMYRLHSEREYYREFLEEVKNNSNRRPPDYPAWLND